MERMAAAMIEVSDLCHVYDGQTVLELGHWQVAEGEQWLLLGPSGCGKTTLLHILAGALTPTRGRVRLAGADLSAMSPGARDLYRGRTIGIVFQRLHLISALDVVGNLILAQRLAGLAVDRARALEVLSALAIADRAHAFPHQLSYGQAQRAALARALINRPRVILADEPTSNLDDDNAERVIDLMTGQARAHGSVLVVATHDRRLRERFPQRLELAAKP